MTKIAIAMAAELAFLGAGDALAGFETGASLNAECALPQSDPRYYEAQANCISYIAGVFDMIEMNANVGDGDSKPGWYVCPPAPVTKGEIVHVFERFLAAAPSMKEYSASVVIWMALSNAYPCQE